MKVSNIIIVAYSVFVLGSIGTLCVTAKNHKDSGEGFKNIQYKEIALKPFSVVVAMDSSLVEIEKSNTYCIKIDTQNQSKSIKKTYEQRGDTLFVYSNSVNNKIGCPDLRMVIGNHHERIRVSQFAPQQIYFELNGGATDITNAGIEEKAYTINIKATKATVSVWNVKLSLMSLDLNGSNLNIENSTIDQLTGELKDKSILSGFSSVKVITAKRDSTSRFE